MSSYCLYNFIAINFADISRFSNLVLKLKVLTKSVSKLIFCQIPSTELKVMASFVFSIVTTFHILACHVTCVDKLFKNFISPDTLLTFRKCQPEKWANILVSCIERILFAFKENAGERSF